MRSLARASMVGEPWSVELVFDDSDAEEIARAARAGKEYMEYAFLPLGVVSRTGKGRPRVAWFRDETEALTFYQDKIAEFSRRKR